MALSNVEYIADGSQTAFGISFPYITRSHVEVYVNGIRQTSGFTINGATLTFTTAPFNGARVLLRRNSARTSRLVNYTSGSITPSTLNRDSIQAFYLFQEAFDAAEEAREAASSAQGTASSALSTANAALSVVNALPPAPAPAPGPAPAPAPAPAPVGVTLSAVSVSQLLSTSFSLAMTVAGTIPAGASMRLEWTDNVASGPWRASPVVAAATGVFSRPFTGVPANTRLYARGLIYTVVAPPAGSPSTTPAENILAITPVIDFTTPAAGGPALTLVNNAPANVTSAGFRLSVTVGGTIPSGALVLIQWTTNPAQGPWRESARTPAVAGVFSFDFTNAPANTSITWRAFVFSDPDVLHIQSPNATFSTPAAGVAPTYSFQFIGDSLFNGTSTNAYFAPRGAFQSLLTAGGIQHTMIGPYTDGAGGGPDPDHAARGGWAIDEVASPGWSVRGNLPTILGASYNPDFIVLQVGWNDLFIGGSAATTAPSRLVDLFNDIRTRKPSAKILFCTLSQPAEPFPYTNAQYVALNNQVRALVTANPTVAALVPLDTLEWSAGDLADYVHYSEQGAAKIAQRIYSALTATGWAVSGGGGSTAPSLLATLVDHMGPQILTLPNLPQNAGWRLGANVIKGGDLRAIANPAWWNFNPRTDLGEFWRFMIPWTVVWDIAGHQDGLNVRYNERNCELWVLHDDDNLWTRLSVESRMGGDAFERNMLNPQVGNLDQRFEADGTSSVRFGPQSPFVWHGYGTWGNTTRPERVRAVLGRVQVRKILDNPGGPDQRNLARYAVQVGVDPYPSPGSPATFGWGYNPGCGLSRFVEVTNDWQWVYFVTLASPPSFSVDTGGPFNSRQTISQALLAANLPPL